jgi:SAM-dependent methyltransferase
MAKSKNIISVKQYLDEEFSGIDVSLGQEELFKRADPDALEIFRELIEEVYCLWGSSYAPVKDIMDAEYEAHDYIYKNPELARICLSVNRDREEKTLQYVMENLQQPKNLLDLGCGEGIKTIYYALTTGADITAIDLIPSGLNLVKEKAMKYRLSNISTVEVDIRDFDLGIGFDGVLANCVLHESGDNREGGFYGTPPNRVEDKVRNIAKHLNPGGTFIATLDECHGSNGMSYTIAKHAENQGLNEVCIETILESEHNSLMAIKAIK